MVLTSFAADSFKEEQLKYLRVREAYKDKGTLVNRIFTSHGIPENELRIYIRAFKKEQELELWGKKMGGAKYQLLKTYESCANSGTLGPKRQQGDLQIPEGYYHIDRFNPSSDYYLSLGLNYPNKSDHVLGVSDNLGGNIFIHGGCQTVGCLPITDDKIKELYIVCVEAKSNGQTTIPVTIFPTHLTDTTFGELQSAYTNDPDKLGLWQDLKKGYDAFNETKTLPSVEFLNSGRHRISP